jgi:peptide/nickel transport system substrate-binding protein
VDVDDYLLPHQMNELKDKAYIQTLEVPSHAADVLIMNMRRKPFDDRSFRLALAYTIPKQRMLDELYNGYGNLGASVVAPANKFWHNSETKPYPFDLEKAREILKKAGYQWNKQGQLCYPPN